MIYLINNMFFEFIHLVLGLGRPSKHISFVVDDEVKPFTKSIKLILGLLHKGRSQHVAPFVALCRRASKLST